MPWLSDGVSHEEGASLVALYGALGESPRLHSNIRRSVDALTGLPTAIARLDGLTGNELVRALVATAVEDPWLGRIAAHRASALADTASVTAAVEKVVWVLDSVELGHFPWALRAVEYVGTANGDLGRHLFRSLGQLVHAPQAVGGRLSALRWIADGIDDEEAALLGTLAFVRTEDPGLFDDLLLGHSAQSTTVTLPLAGDVNVWLLQRDPFPPDDETLSTAALSIRAIEDLFGVPFPATDVVVLLVGDATIDIAGYYVGTFVIVRRSHAPAVPHEIAHYYELSASIWLKEGVAEFARAYVDDRRGVQSLSGRRPAAREAMDRECGAENLRHLIYIIENRRLRFGNCEYPMGEHFLLSVFETIGEEGFLSALGELYLRREFSPRPITEEQIYTTFLENTPPELQEDFRDVYRRLHGGPYTDPDLDLADDYPDEARSAPTLAIGEVVEGNLDYMFDFDYFRFRAEAGERYEINVEHATLGLSSAGLFDYLVREMTTSPAVKVIRRTPSGYQVLWIADRSADHYFAVRNFGGWTGPYRLSIDRPGDPPDDHGDTPETATGLALDEVVEGVMDDHFDFDYFWFDAEAGREYRIYTNNRFMLRGSYNIYLRVKLYSSSGDRIWTSTKGELEGDSYGFVAARSGRYYVRVENWNDIVGRPYVLAVRGGPFPEPWVPRRVAD